MFTQRKCYNSKGVVCLDELRTKQETQNSFRENITIKKKSVIIAKQRIEMLNQEDKKMQFEQLQKDMVAAMKARDKVRKDAISALVSAAKKVAIDEGCREDIPEELVDRVILKEIKSVKEQLDSCPDSRADLKEEYQARFNIFEEYAPKMMSAEEVENFISEKFAEIVASKNKGMIMKNVMPELKGKAEGSVINQVVAKLCQ